MEEMVMTAKQKYNLGGEFTKGLIGSIPIIILTIYVTISYGAAIGRIFLFLFLLLLMALYAIANPKIIFPSMKTGNIRRGVFTDFVFCPHCGESFLYTENLPKGKVSGTITIKCIYCEEAFEEKLVRGS